MRSKQGKQLKKTSGLEGVPTTRANFIFSPVWSASNSVKVGGNLAAAVRDWKGGLGTSPPCSTQSGWPPELPNGAPLQVLQCGRCLDRDSTNLSTSAVFLKLGRDLTADSRIIQLWSESWRDQFFECCLNDPTAKKKKKDKKKTHMRFTDAGAQTWEEPSFIPLDGDLIQRRETSRWKMIEIRAESSRLFDGQALPRPSYTLARRKYVSGNDTSIPSYT